MKPSGSHKVIISLWWEKLSIFTTEAHRWSRKLFFPSQKQDQKSNQRAAAANQISASVAAAAADRAAIGGALDRGSLQLADGVWRLHCLHGNIASLLLRKVKRRGRGEATLTQTLPLYYSSFVPQSERRRTNCCVALDAGDWWRGGLGG